MKIAKVKGAQITPYKVEGRKLYDRETGMTGTHIMAPMGPGYYK